ncbi:hypothetical protein FOL47_001799 [Perkinsus chesapeaki]|uniref:RRM domain-containing protein n=1 Tax=Perkinsus chesapeaki TaxID=330153 RepID=A0A7J6MH85_PERCH|nr:hypothetical protein FOL47_001799 [Perkinsus chesapeaki]
MFVHSRQCLSSPTHFSHISKVVPHFYVPYYGASKMRWYPVPPYRRLRPSSLHHYPEVSKVTGKRINWYTNDPQSGYEGAKMFGPNTLELDGLPMGRTPEYMQERLRRFFSKFGVVKICRAIPHELDPYQCQGKAYVTFRDRRSAFRALKAPLKFPASLHDKFVKMRDLDTDKRSDPLYLVKSEHNNEQLISVARQLHGKLLSGGPRAISTVWQGIMEQEFRTERVTSEVDIDEGLRTADHCVIQRFGSWKDFLESEGMNHIVHCDGQKVSAKPMTPVRLEKQLLQLSIELSKKLKAECSVHWRQGREHIPLPDHTRFLMRKWDHHEKLAWCLQTMSHNHFYQRVYDPKLIAKWRIKRERNVARNKAREEKRLEAQQMAAIGMLEETPVSVDRRELRKIRNRNVWSPTSKSPTNVTCALEGSPYPAAEYPLRSYLEQDKRKHVRVHSEPQWRFNAPGPCTSMEVGWHSQPSALDGPTRFALRAPKYPINSSAMTKEVLLLSVSIASGQCPTMSVVKPAVQGLLDTLDTVEGLVTFDEVLEGVVTELEKEAFRGIMEALAKLFRSLPAAEAQTARQDFVDFDGLRRLYSTYVLLLAEEQTEEDMIENLTTIFFPFLEPIVLGCRDARALVDGSGLLKTTSELCKFAIAAGKQDAAVCRGIRLMVTGCDNAKWTVLKTGLLDHILDLLRRQSLDKENQPDLQVLLCMKALIIDDDKLAKNPAHVWARELCCDENHLTNTRVVLRRMREIGEDGNQQMTEVLALLLREFSNTTDNAKVLANPAGDDFLSWAIDVLHAGFEDFHPTTELLKTMRTTSSFVRQVAFIDDLKLVVSEILISKALLPLMTEWIGRLHNEGEEKDSNEMIKSGIADNVFGIIANITMRQPEIVERLSESFDMMSLIKLSIGAYSKKSARTEKQILQVLNNFLRSPKSRNKCIEGKLLDDVAWHWANDWDKMRLFDKKKSKAIGWSEVYELAQRILIETRHESTAVEGS